jgi:hypothetical protein
MCNRRTLTSRKGRSIETTYSNVEALRRLEAGLADGAIKSAFGRDLVAKGASLSYDQTVWVHVLVVEAERGHDTPPKAGGLDLSEFVAMMDRAAERGRANNAKRSPRIRFPRHQVTLTRSGARSKREGTIQITDGRPYGENTWYGRIERDGSVSIHRQNWTEAIHELLAAIEVDLAAVTSASGIATGECSFCTAELTTSESLTVGYGPVCAKKYGLPWGAVDEAAEAA